MATLSENADELLDALGHVVPGECPAALWWAALAEHERDLAAVAAQDAGVDLQQLLRYAGEHSVRAAPLTRAGVADRATARAAEDGREVAGIGDVAAALVASTLADREHPHST